MGGPVTGWLLSGRGQDGLGSGLGSRKHKGDLQGHDSIQHPVVILCGLYCPVQDFLLLPQCLNPLVIQGQELRLELPVLLVPT